MIQSLEPNQVFVFGSNSQGFHGAGAAGFACRGDASNNWRTDLWFLQAMQSLVGSPDRIGKWAVYGVARGFQVGREGKSYAIQTVARPGQRRSVSILDIKNQIIEFWKFAKANPELEFLVSALGEGYAGYSKSEMDQVWDSTKASLGDLPNVRFIR